MHFWKNESGATLVYISLMIAMLAGIIGLALDSGRIINLKHEVQAAADAAALAGAWQLDGSQAGSVKADTAARATPVLTNNQKFGDTPGAVGIASTAFYGTVPADDDTPLSDVANAAGEYVHIEVTATGVAQSTMLMRVLGAAATSTVNAKAVARKGQATCQVTPLMFCLPAGFDPTNLIGHQILAKAGGGGQQVPGNWGLLDNPGGSQSAPALANMIAGVNGLPQCIGTLVDTKPGNVASITPAFNVRLDMYENLPGNVNHRTTAGYPPAEHVVKQQVRTNANCNNFNALNRPLKMDQDTDIKNGTAVNRIGNGQWDCQTYWNTNHPNGPSAPSGCGPAASTTISRYEVYLHEVMSNLIPNTTGGAPGGYGAVGPNAGEDGRASASSCYTGGPIPPTPTALSQRINDRRILTVAGIDCATVNGNTPNIPVQYYMSMFLTEPAVTANGPNRGDVYLEIVGHDVAGGGGLVPVQLREWVELVR